ncbi:hypothetical protein GCM10007036_21320 [Alsobacter metallidurans]|uniref:Uncharacterized protein n=1 Tax=Alsobacter metallidurans TaxID=340221 RepID=A0A917I7F2_9HYPH|nr:hypothetical protein [Alsobacter metallidurans]GGH18861.1 hypothetical protein GCM10007036_21320 [Alsobacter metallidurans]
MSTPATPPAVPTYPTEADVDAIMAEFGGDTRAAIKALLEDLATLADDREASVSAGFVRGRQIRIVGRP